MRILNSRMFATASPGVVIALIVLLRGTAPSRRRGGMQEIALFRGLNVI